MTWRGPSPLHACCLFHHCMPLKSKFKKDRWWMQGPIRSSIIGIKLKMTHHWWHFLGEQTPLTEYWLAPQRPMSIKLNFPNPWSGTGLISPSAWNQRSTNGIMRHTPWEPFIGKTVKSIISPCTFLGFQLVVTYLRCQSVQKIHQAINLNQLWE